MDMRTTPAAEKTWVAPTLVCPPANDNPVFAFAMGEEIEVMTRGVIMERCQTAAGRTYLIRATKDDGREIFIRAAETDVYESEPRAAVQVAA